MPRTSLRRVVALWVDEGLLLILSSSIYRSYSRLERYSNEYSDGFGRPIVSGVVRLGKSRGGINLYQCTPRHRVRSASATGSLRSRFMVLTSPL
jgi:hypothetical protein